MWHHKLCILLVDILLAAAPPPLLAGGEVLLVGQLKQQLPLQLEQPPGVDLVDGRLQQVVVQPLTLVHCSAVGIENRLQTIDDHLFTFKRDSVYHKMFSLSPLIHHVYYTRQRQAKYPPFSDKGYRTVSTCFKSGSTNPVSGQLQVPCYRRKNRNNPTIPSAS